MNIESFREYCLSKPGTTEGTPFGPDVLVLKVGGKMFALADIENFVSINVKCDPDYAVELRERYDGVVPGYHMSKTHWNTVLTDGSISDKLLKTWIDDSYQLIFDSLPKKIQEEIKSK